MEIVIGGIIGLLNLVILFELNRMTNEITSLRTRFDGVIERVARLEAEVQACPSCRDSVGN